MSGLESLTEVAPAALGAAAGGGGTYLIAKVLFSRMLNDYDKKHEHHSIKIEALTERLNEATIRIAVLERILKDARTLRVDVAHQVSAIKAELDTKHAATVEAFSELKDDVYVAHERLRLLAKGESDLSKVQKPIRSRRR